MWGMKLKGYYTAEWIEDDGYPDETEPAEIQLDSLAVKKVS